MPGIVGMISSRPPGECGDVVAGMANLLRHESFYISSEYSDPELKTYVASIAHENSFASDRRLSQSSRDVAVIFSGECYADAEVVRQLEKGPTHWLVRLYEKMGDRFVAELNGLFSGVVIDRAKKKVILFNDRYGFGRIYWHESKDGFYFATEAKALLRMLPCLRAFDNDGLAQYLALGTTLENRTLFKAVNTLPAASAWVFQRGECEKRVYFSPATWELQSPLSVEGFEHEFESTFRRVLPYYFDSAADIGISLTAGLDSRMMMASLPENVGHPVCYTYVGQKGETLDARLAARVANVCNLKHHLLRLGQDFFSDFANHAARTVYLTDGYHGIAGAHEIYLSRQARNLAPIRLTGVFGGEVLRSVSTFKPLQLDSELFIPDFRRDVNLQGQQFVRRAFHPVTFAAFNEIPKNIFGSLAATSSQLTFRTPYLDNHLVALAYRAPAATRSTRVAELFVQKSDPRLGKIPTDMGLLGDYRGILRGFSNALSKFTFKLDYLCNDGMPHWFSFLDPIVDRLNSKTSILGLHKYLRYRRWFRSELADYVRTELQDAELLHGPWNAKFVKKLAERHISGERNYLAEINAVLTVRAVDQLVFRPV